MPKNNIHETIDMMTPFEFDDPRKPEYHRLGRRVLKQLARDLDIPEGSYDIRSNKGGPAVSGEITLHSEHIYVTINSSSKYFKAMFRSCKGRKDYTGSSNNIFCRVSDLTNGIKFEAMQIMISAAQLKAHQASLDCPLLRGLK